MCDVVFDVCGDGVVCCGVIVMCDVCVWLM